MPGAPPDGEYTRAQLGLRYDLPFPYYSLYTEEFIFALLIWMLTFQSHANLTPFLNVPIPLI